MQFWDEIYQSLPRTQTSLSICAQRKAGRRHVPFPWSLAVYHQSLVSRSPLPCEKRSAWGGGCTRVLNFAGHLPNPWTNMFAHINDKQPEFSSNDRLPFCLQIILCNRLDGITQYKFVGVVAPLQISLLSLLATSFYHKGGNHCKFAIIFSFSWLAE